MKRTFVALVATAALTVGQGLIPMTVQATTNGELTQLGVTPGTQVADGCYAAAHWTVTLGGGTSGPWSVDVAYGDGYSPPAYQTYSTSVQWSYTFNTGCTHHDYYQTWWASRAGGGTAYAYTSVTSN